MKQAHIERCPTCQAVCEVTWSGLELVKNSGDETLAEKHYRAIQPPHKIPEGDIEIYINFPNDPSVGLQPAYYRLTAPDFRTDWTETEEELQKYIQEKRNEIKNLYEQFGGEPCEVLFSFDRVCQYEATEAAEQAPPKPEIYTLEEMEQAFEAGGYRGAYPNFSEYKKLILDKK